MNQLAKILNEVLTLEQVLEVLQKEFKDIPKIGIYSGTEANRLYKHHEDEDDFVVDKEYEDTTLYACQNFAYIDGTDEEYLDGAYFINFNDDLVLELTPSTPPTLESRILGIEAIIKKLHGFAISHLPVKESARNNSKFCKEVLNELITYSPLEQQVILEQWKLASIQNRHERIELMKQDIAHKQKMIKTMVEQIEGIRWTLNNEVRWADDNPNFKDDENDEGSKD